MALVLLIALALPALIIIGGSRRPAETTVDVAAPLTSLVAATDPSTTDASPSSEVTEAARWTTVPEATSEDPTTSASAAATSSTAPSTTSTTAKPKATSTTTAAPTTTKAPVVAAVQAAPSTTSAPSTTAPPTTAKPVVVATSPPVGTQSEAAFLACVRQRESGGNYGAVSPGGTYMGAYQFAQSTWDGTARMAGRNDLVGMKPNLASPADQDQMAITLYRSAGAAPWGGHCP